MLLATRHRGDVAFAPNRVNMPVRMAVHELADDGVAKVHLFGVFHFILMCGWLRLCPSTRVVGALVTTCSTCNKH